MSKHNFGVVIGRFQPCHRMHLKAVIVPALEASDTLLVLLGSSQRPRTPKDPWTDLDRMQMIRSGLKDCGHDYPWGLMVSPDRSIQAIHNENGKVIIFAPILDSCYSDNRWQMGVQQKVQEAIDYVGEREDYKVTLFGVDRDESTFYLNMFPQWENHTLNLHDTKDEVNGTMCRDYILSKPASATLDLGKHLTPDVATFIYEWRTTEAFSKIKEEFDFLKSYRQDASNFKYPIVFQTTDNLIVYKGHILLVNRRSFPGKGLWALPGGFLDSKLSLLESTINITKEKTKLSLRPEWLVRHKTFDAPNRSLRGRTITTTYHWIIPDRLPNFNHFNVEPGKNTNKVKWVQFSDVMRMSAELYEDHYDIIVDMLSSVG